MFVSHGGMNDRGSTCKFRNARSAFFSSVFHTSMRNKQVEFNPYIYSILDQNCPVLAMKYPFLNTLHNRAVFRMATGAAGSYVMYVSSWKNGCQNFSYVHRSRKHWECKKLRNNLQPVSHAALDSGCSRYIKLMLPTSALNHCVPRAPVRDV